MALWHRYKDVTMTLTNIYVLGKTCVEKYGALSVPNNYGISTQFT
jgi:hypothetical protein